MKINNIAIFISLLLVLVKPIETSALGSDSIINNLNLVEENEMTLIKNNGKSIILSRMQTSVKIEFNQDSANTNKFNIFLRSNKENLFRNGNTLLKVISNPIGFEINSIITKVNSDNIIPFYMNVSKEVGFYNYEGNSSYEKRNLNIFDDNGLPSGVITYPKIHDSNGVQIDSKFVINNNKIEIQLENNASLISPIFITYSVLPQYTFSDFFFSTSGFITRPEGVSLSLKVNKNANGWYINDTGTDILDTSWSVVYNKYSPYGNWYNTDGLYKQYRCHLNYVWIWQTSWEIEPWRPNVSYQDTVTALCNP